MPKDLILDSLEIQRFRCFRDTADRASGAGESHRWQEQRRQVDDPGSLAAIRKARFSGRSPGNLLGPKRDRGSRC